MPYGGRGRVQRHHRDSDRLNNSAENIAFLCVQHHKDAHRKSDKKLGGGARPRIATMMRDRAMERAQGVHEMVAEGHSVAEIARLRGVDPGTVRRWVKRYPA